MFKWLKRSNENPANPLSVPGTGGDSSQNRTVTQFSCFGIPALWNAVQCISGDIARCDFDLYRKTSTGFRVQANHRAHFAVRHQWNERLESFLGWRRLMVHALIWGRGYAWIRTPPDGGDIELFNLLPDLTHYDTNTGLYVAVLSDQDTYRYQYLYPSEILAVENISWDHSKVLALLVHANDSWSAALNATDFKNRFFNQGVISGGSLEIPEHVSKAAADNIETGFYERHANKNHWFRTVVLREGAKLSQNNINPREFELTDSVESSARDIARWFGIPASKLSVKDAASYGEKAEDNQAYLDALSPWMVAIQKQCWMKLLTETEKRGEQLQFAHNTRQLFAANPRTMAEIGEIESRNGFITANEYRLDTHRDPFENAGDVRRFPGGSLVIDTDGNIFDPAGQPAESDPEPIDEPIDEPTEPINGTRNGKFHPIRG